MKAGTYKIEIDDSQNEIWYDFNGNMIYYKDFNNLESWWEYDSDGNKIHFRNSNGYEKWYDYDPNGNMIHVRNSDGYEFWYDSKGNAITQKEFNRIHKPCQGKTVTIEGKEYMLVSKF